MSTAPASPEPAIHAAYARLFLAFLNERGLDAARLARAVGLSASDRASDTLLAYAPAQRLIAAASAATASPWLGLEFGSRMHAGSHGSVGFAALAAGSVGEALRTWVRFAPLRVRALHFQWQETAETLGIDIHPAFDLGSAHAFIHDTVLSLCDGMLYALTGAALPSANWRMPGPAPAWSGMYRRFLAHPVTFAGDHLQLRVARDVAAQPCIHADPVAARLAREDCERRLHESQPGRDLAARVRQMLRSEDQRLPDSHTMAARLHLSPRSFFRKLREAGISWQALLDEARRERAQWLLQCCDDSIERVAERLGYADASNLARHCRRWSGLTPRAWRRRLRADADG